jgi:hypothetical protein
VTHRAWVPRRRSGWGVNREENQPDSSRGQPRKNVWIAACSSHQLPTKNKVELVLCISVLVVTFCI